MITITTLQSFFMWCSIINIVLLIAMFLVLTLGKEWAYSIHSRWFDISHRTFDLVLYCFLGIYKLLVWVFCIIPWIALSIIG